MKLELYEPHMCCPTGLCGPSPDEKLLRVNETLKALKTGFPGLQVERHMISQNPMRFKQNAAVFALIQKHGKGVLPVVTLNGKVISKGRYPGLDEIKAYIERDRGGRL